MSRRIFMLRGGHALNPKTGAGPAGEKRFVRAESIMQAQLAMAPDRMFLSRDFMRTRILKAQIRDLKKTGGTPLPAFSKPERR